MNKHQSLKADSASWLNLPAEHEMDKDVQDLVAMFGGDNWARALTVAPKSMRRFTDFIQSLFAEDGTDISLRDRELVAVAVSRANGCGYCVGHHSFNLGEIIGDKSEAYKFALEPRFANLSARDMAMVGFAEKVTKSPSDIREEDIEALRGHGITDQNIAEILETTGYFNFANRMFLAMGCPIDDRVASR